MSKTTAVFSILASHTCYIFTSPHEWLIPHSQELDRKTSRLVLRQGMPGYVVVRFRAHIFTWKPLSSAQGKALLRVQKKAFQCHFHF